MLYRLLLVAGLFGLGACAQNPTNKPSEFLAVNSDIQQASRIISPQALSATVAKIEAETTGGTTPWGIDGFHLGRLAENFGGPLDQSIDIACCSAKDAEQLLAGKVGWKFFPEDGKRMYLATSSETPNFEFLGGSEIVDIPISPSTSAKMLSVDIKRNGWTFENILGDDSRQGFQGMMFPSKDRTLMMFVFSVGGTSQLSDIDLTRLSMAIQTKAFELLESGETGITDFNYQKVAFPAVNSCTTRENSVFENIRSNIPENLFSKVVRQVVTHDCMSLRNTGSTPGVFEDDSTFVYGSPLIWLSAHPDAQPLLKKGTALPIQLTEIRPWR